MMHISHIFDQCKPKLIAIRKRECMQIWQLFLFHGNKHFAELHSNNQKSTACVRML